MAEILKMCNDKKQPKNYKHQDEIASILEKMDGEKKTFSTIISVPTGGGKTKIAVDFCIKVLKDDKNRILWLADRVNLLKQSVRCFQHVNIPRDISYQIICSEEDQEETISAVEEIKENSNMLFASVASLVAAVSNEEKQKKFAEWLEAVKKFGKLYIIYDEAHHIGASKISKLLEEILSNRKDSSLPTIENFALIGLTATVYRYESSVESFSKWFKDGWSNDKKEIVSDDSPIGRKSDGDINNRIEIVDVKQLIDSGILKKPTLIRIDDFKNGIPKDEEAYLADKIKKYYKEEKWGKTIIFVGTKHQAQNLEKELKKRHVPCFAYVSGYSHEEEKKISKEYEKFQNEADTSKLMIAVDKVSEGFDVRDLKTIYLYSKTESQIKMRQRVGRVLRTSDKKDNCNVIWQKYYKKVLTIQKTCDTYLKEDEKEIQRDIAEFSKGGQLPPAIFLEPLPTDSKKIRELYLRLEFLEILDLFGITPFTEGNGVYSFNIEGKKIYFTSSEKKGYLQYYQMILSDYYSLLRHKAKYKSFSDYAEALHIDEKMLVDNIMKICFYMSNIREKDTKGAIAKKRLTVLEEDIKCFYEYVISKNLEMPIEYATFAKNDSEQKENLSEPEDQRKNFEIDLIKKYVEDHGKKSNDLIDAMKVHQKIINPKKEAKLKEYSDSLPYGKNGEFQYSEMKSARFLMNMGAVYQDRIEGKIKNTNITGELAFIGCDEDGSYKLIKPIRRRTTNRIARDELIVIASALNTVPNHISITESDLCQYAEELIKNIPTIFETKEVDSKKLVREFLMALGYNRNNNDNRVENDSIIRMQCKIFGSSLPRIVQYVIYCKCYEELIKEIDFYENDKLHVTCQNREYLEKLYKSRLQSYKMEQLDTDLTPLEDAIYDSRPYLKAVPLYQGIKPEFLCRMLNDILLLSKNKGKYKTIVDAFGGSGAVSMNINEKHRLKIIYNDFGIMNEYFYSSLKEKNGLRKMVEEFIDLVINHTGDEKNVKKFFKCYERILQADTTKNKDEENYNFLEDSCKEIEEKYRKKKDQKDLLSTLGNLEEKYKSIYESLLPSGQNIDPKRILEIHNFLHPLILKIGKIYRIILKCENDKLKEILNEEQLAFIFFINNSFISRYFYSGATIDNLDKFVGNYNKWLDWGEEIFSRDEIKIECGDAIELMKKYKDQKDYVWYCDIPYIGTSTVSYAGTLKTNEFLSTLSNMSSDYIVSSRFNIIEDKNLSTQNCKNSDLFLLIKKMQIFLFYNSFVSKEFAKSYESDLQSWLIPQLSKKELSNIEIVKELLDSKSDIWQHLTEGREAKYILFAYTKARSRKEKKKENDGEKGKEKENDGEKGKEKGKKKEGDKEKIVSATDVLSKDAICRMLESTWISKIPVEIMLTNIEIDMNMMPIQEICKGKIWYMPTFATPNPYMAEPVVIIIKYEEYIWDILLKFVDEKFDSVLKSKIIAASFRAYYNKMMEDCAKNKKE